MKYIIIVMALSVVLMYAVQTAHAITTFDIINKSVNNSIAKTIQSIDNSTGISNPDGLFGSTSPHHHSATNTAPSDSSDNSNSNKSKGH